MLIGAGFCRQNIELQKSALCTYINGLVND